MANEAQASAVKAFDFEALKNRIGAKLVASKQVLIDALKAPVKIAVAETVDWAAEGCAMNSSTLVQGVGGLILGSKGALLNAIDKV